MSKVYLVHGNAYYEGYGHYEHFYGAFTDGETAKKVMAKVQWELYQKEIEENYNCTEVEELSDIEIEILEVDLDQVTDIYLGGYAE